jgi:DNA adenine methylase
MQQSNYPITRLPDYPIRPLLKWAGGKRQLLPQLRRFYPRHFETYIEPFLGSGAVFFDLHAAGRLRGRAAILIDANADLIGCYEAVRDKPEEVARGLQDLADAHGIGGAAHYYEVRDRAFNPLRESLREPNGRISYTPDLAAMFIYLNRTGFNGLFRLNARGAFNVPIGRYDRPRICHRDRLLSAADALSAPGVRLCYGAFDSMRDLAGPGDFLYIDPPYAPVSPTANFTSYTSERFDAADQERLQALVVSLARRGCQVLLSNSVAGHITTLYAGDLDASRAGLRALRVSARRSINRRAGGRGPVEEYLITNIQAAGAPG